MMNYMLNGKVLVIHLIVGLVKKILLYKMSYFAELYTCSQNKTKIELNLSKYATKSENNRCRYIRVWKKG